LRYFILKRDLLFIHVKQAPKAIMLPALLSLNEAITTLGDREEVFRFIADTLRELFAFEMCVVLTLNAEQTHTQAFMRSVALPSSKKNARGERTTTVQTSLLHGQTKKVTEDPVGMEMKKHGVMMLRNPILGSPTELFLANPITQVLDAPQFFQQFPNYPPYRYMAEIGIKQMVVVPLRSLGRIIGILVLASRKRYAPDVPLLEQVAGQISVAVNNALTYDELRRREQEAIMRLAVNNALVTVKTIKDRDAMFSSVANELKNIIPLDFLGVRVLNSAGEMTEFANYRANEDGIFQPVEREPNPLASKGNMVSLLRTTALYTGESFTHFCEQNPIGAFIRDHHGVRSIIYVNIWNNTVDDKHEVSALVIASGTENAFTEDDLQLLKSLAPQIELAMRNMFAFDEISQLKVQLEQERNYLQEEIKTSVNFDEIIGSSPALKRVLRLVEQVASVDSTVLLTGETGTGKELIARAIHNRSPRSDRALIKLNCAALPAQLIESELFGHEKGAFTGATERRIGKFELANGGTIFLDEIGELPLELQAKLLRVLQEREFERVGGSQVLTTNVRVIAATNRTLEREVEKGSFRTDLFFRLNVFTIQLPSLRERIEDIPILAEHFAQKYARKLGKQYRRIAEEDMMRLLRYDWSGNIRELENVIERAVIVSGGGTLDIGNVGKTKKQMCKTSWRRPRRA
jgi:transcriptional regulator with GAF, ATPase, and Fis domain